MEIFRLETGGISWPELGENSEFGLFSYSGIGGLLCPGIGVFLWEVLGLVGFPV